MFKFLFIFLAFIFSDIFANKCTIVMGTSCFGPLSFRYSFKKRFNKIKRLNRSEKANKNGRNFVIKTFNIFENIKAAKNFDKLVSS